MYRDKLNRVAGKGRNRKLYRVKHRSNGAEVYTLVDGCGATHIKNGTKNRWRVGLLYELLQIFHDQEQVIRVRWTGVEVEMFIELPGIVIFG